jgi:hypothetical protein
MMFKHHIFVYQISKGYAIVLFVLKYTHSKADKWWRLKVLLLKFILNVSNTTNVPHSQVQSIYFFCGISSTKYIISHLLIFVNTVKLCDIIELLVSQFSKAMKSSNMVIFTSHVVLIKLSVLLL